jgi:hypothetical protein
MLAPGAILSATGNLPITAGAGQVPNYINQGVGFMNNGSVAIDTNVPAAAATFNGGIAQSAAGALHGTVAPAGTDGTIAGIRVSALGQVVYEAAAAVLFSSGNGITSNGRLATV